ncbi:hypothetical protein [Microbacterium sp. bgisy189]|uniref:hypothetical protein n=1 Tax=Microbacterium sp. bgisy189 TaxID=3413798 RepID=UPI003EBEBBA1
MPLVGAKDAISVFEDAIEVLDSHVVLPDESTKGPKPSPIRPGRPLSIRIVSVFPGDDAHKRGRDAILTSAVRSPLLQNAKPLAMHYMYQRLEYGRLLSSRADEPGSDVVYYSPAELSQELDVTIRFAFDRFNKKTFESWVDAAATAAALPVFAVSGPAGAAWVTVAKTATKLIGRTVDKLIDGDNDRVMTWRVNLSSPGKPLTKAGYVLLYPDGNTLIPAHIDADSGEIVSEDGTFERNGEQFVVVDGKLCWSETKAPVVEGDSYVLVYINGAKISELDGWGPAAVAAGLSERFLNADRVGAEDALEAFRLFNDIWWLRQLDEIEGELAEAQDLPDGADKTKAIKALIARRTAAHKNIQDTALRQLSKK